MTQDIKMKHWCRGCDEEGSLNIACSCHGMHMSYQCSKCGNCGLVSAACPVCMSSGNVSSWEEVKNGILFQRGDLNIEVDDGPDPDEEYEHLRDRDDDW